MLIIHFQKALLHQHTVRKKPLSHKYNDKLIFAEKLIHKNKKLNLVLFNLDHFKVN